jgi:hypothetical protein
VSPLATLGTHARSDGDAVEEFLRSHFQRRPVDATFAGLHLHDARLPDWSPDGLDALRDDLRNFRGQFARDGIASLTDSALLQRNWLVIDGALIDSYLEIQLAELESRNFIRGNPSLVIGEVAFGIIGLITRDALPVGARAASLLARLRDVPRFLAGAHRSLLGAPIPQRWVERALRECAGTSYLLRDGVPRWCHASGLGTDISDALREAAMEAFGALAAFEQALPGMGTGREIRECGPEFLTLLIERGHWLDRSIPELLREAKSDLDEAKSRLDGMTAPDGLRPVQARLSDLHPTPEEYYDSFRRTWDACHDRALERELLTWPDAPVQYVAIPEWTRMAAPSLYYLYYRSPPPFAPLAVHEYVVTPVEGLDGSALESHLRAWNDSVIKLNHVVHHGALGHHVQNWYAARSPSRVGQIAATDCASRIAMFPGGSMAEGWACYATDLMEAVGFLTPDEQIAEQHGRVRMAARACVDLELHAGTMSFADGVAFYQRVVEMPADAAKAETVKNSMFPGTAMMYWLGTRGIHGIRREHEQRLGARFSLRKFHDTLLSFGSLPVSLIARLMKADAIAR